MNVNDRAIAGWRKACQFCVYRPDCPQFCKFADKLHCVACGEWSSAGQLLLTCNLSHCGGWEGGD